VALASRGAGLSSNATRATLAKDVADLPGNVHVLLADGLVQGLVLRVPYRLVLAEEDLEELAGVDQCPNITFFRE
jgi:hypothetical protein